MAVQDFLHPRLRDPVAPETRTADRVGVAECTVRYPEPELKCHCCSLPFPCGTRLKNPITAQRLFAGRQSQKCKSLTRLNFHLSFQLLC